MRILRRPREIRRRVVLPAGQHVAGLLPAGVLLVSALLVGVLLPGGQGAGGALEAASPAPPEVRFVVEDPTCEQAAARCRSALADRGPDLVAFLVPDDCRLQTITCLLLSGPSFAERFSGLLPDWGIGVALAGGRTIAIDCSRQPGGGRGIQEIFLHELTHALVAQALPGARMPTWFQEGVAMRASGEWRFVDSVEVIFEGPLPPLWRLEGPFPAPAAWADQAYRTSLLAVDSMCRWYGQDVIRRLLTATRSEGDFPETFASVTGQSLDAFADRFARAMHTRFGWLVMLTRWPGLFTLLALLFAVGATVRLIRNRRRLARLPDEPWPRG